MMAGGVLFSKLLLFAAVAAPVFIIDQWSKSIITEIPLPIIVNDYLRLINVRNDGIAFGLFAGGGQFGIWFFSILALVLFAALLFCAARSDNFGERVAMALMAGGALGNVYDRLDLGYVVDFIDAHFGTYHWPAFNVADIAITAGALWWMFLLIRRR